MNLLKLKSNDTDINTDINTDLDTDLELDTDNHYIYDAENNTRLKIVYVKRNNIEFLDNITYTILKKLLHNSNNDLTKNIYNKLFLKNRIHSYLNGSLRYIIIELVCIDDNNEIVNFMIERDNKQIEHRSIVLDFIYVNDIQYYSYDLIPSEIKNTYIENSLVVKYVPVHDKPFYEYYKKTNTSSFTDKNTGTVLYNRVDISDILVNSEHKDFSLKLFLKKMLPSFLFRNDIKTLIKYDYTKWFKPIDSNHMTIFKQNFFCPLYLLSSERLSECSSICSNYSF